MAIEKFPLDFLIVGTMKSGTSSLSEILSQHPSVGIPDKEVHYFDTHLAKGSDWYKKVLLAEKNPNTLILGEKTPNYTWDESHLKNLHELAPEVKMIWIFRNPAERAFSHYNHNLNAGREHLSFEKALVKEGERRQSDSHYGYRNVSAYATHVKRALKYFPIEQMHFLTLEAFKTDPKKEIDEICQFLTIDGSLAPVYYAHSHKTVIPKYPFLRYAARKGFGYGSALWNVYYRTILPKEPVQPPSKLKPELKQRLIQEFQPEITELKKLTGLDTSVWG